MKNRITIACLGLILASTSAMAQVAEKDTTLNRTVVVEREFNPVIERTTKVNVLPKVEEPNITPKKVEYDLTAVQPRSYAVALVKPLVALEEEKIAPRGYFRFGFGNYGNIDGRAHYTFVISPKDKLTLDLTSYGMNGELDQYYFEDKENWDAFYYRTMGHIDYEHKFSAATLTLNGGYRVNNFNYADLRELFIPLLNDSFKMKKQRFNTANFSVGLKSTDEDIFIKYDINSQYSLYQRQVDYIEPEMRESALKTTAKLRTDLTTDNAVGLDLAMYNRVVSGSQTKNSTTFDINPYYAVLLNNWAFRLGAHVDLGFGQGESILLSPDVSAELNVADSYKIYVKATGGRIKSDFTQMEELSPYTLISGNNRDAYEQINASIGVKGSPLDGLWFTAYGGYQRIKDDLFQEINQTSFPTTVFANGDTDNSYVGGMVQYQYRKMFEFILGATYRNWSSKNEKAGAILFKPKLEVEAGVRLNPMSKLAIGVDYKFVDRAENEKLDLALSVGKINKLSAYASYEFVKNLSVYAKVDNIFNKKFQYFYGYPIEGTNFIAGLSFKL